MKGNLRFIIIPTSGGYKLICQYQSDEVTWGPFKTLPEVSDRIRLALTNLEQKTK
jgi:hypothetical protein